MSDKMNKKKIVILILLFLSVAGFTLDTVSAASKTVNVKDSYKFSVKNIGKGDEILVGYMSKYDGQSGKSRNLHIGLSSKYEYGEGLYYKINKATVTYKSKGKTFTRTYNGQYISKIVPKGWTPKKVKVFYSKKSKPTMVKTAKINSWYTSVSVGNGEVITLTDGKDWKQYSYGDVLKRHIIIQLVNMKYGGTKYYKLQKVEVTFRDIENNYSFLKTYKPKTYRLGKGFQYMVEIYDNPNYKPTKAVFFYSKL